VWSKCINRRGLRKTKSLTGLKKIFLSPNQWIKTGEAMQDMKKYEYQGT